MSRPFEISPEEEASTSQYLYRQLFVTPPVLSKQECNVPETTAIIPGSNIGIGLECARQLFDLAKLLRLVIAVPDVSKGEAALDELFAGTDCGSAAVWKLDLSSYDSIIKFVERVQSLRRLDIVTLNADGYSINPTFSPTGFEEDTQVNYLSTALLTILLLPILKAKSSRPPGRLTIVSSDSAAWAKFNEKLADPLLPAFKAPFSPGQWDMKERYFTSKLLGQLFVSELARQIPLPWRFGGLLGFAAGVITCILGRSYDVGARPVTAAAVKFGDEVHGQYVEDNEIRPMAPIIYKPEGQRLAKKLWEELLDELSFAGVRDVLNDLRK